jgi:hypothetical protein
MNNIDEERGLKNLLTNKARFARLVWWLNSVRNERFADITSSGKVGRRAAGD